VTQLIQGLILESKALRVGSFTQQSRERIRRLGGAHGKAFHVQEGQERLDDPAAMRAHQVADHDVRRAAPEQKQARRLGVFLPLAALVLSCAAHEQRESPKSVTIPSYESAPAPSSNSALPKRTDLPSPPVEGDPFRYYVGKWSGLVNGHLNTDMEVLEDGRYRVTLSPAGQRTQCEIAGHLRVTELTIAMDIETSSCPAEQPGTTLERTIGSKSDDEFSVQSDDGRIFIRYVRKAR
jgi:hypothetical protein